MDKDISADNLATMRHTAAHMLAAASTKLRPETKLGVGPAIDDGFYHDIDVDQNYTDADLAGLEKEMAKIKRMDLPIKQREVSKNEARKIFVHDPYKLELIEEIPGDTVGVSDMGDGFFVTLCGGGHVASTGKVGFFKLTRLAGVYWKGDEKNKQLQRIYGVLFPTKKELGDYLAMLAEAKKRDHRKLGKLLDLFTFSPLVGAGLPLFTPRGAMIRRQLEEFIQSLQEPRGYQRVTIPHLAKPALYETSGHWDKFKDDLFHVTGKANADFVIKPMNCPHHTQIYASRQRSYRELPLRLAEITAVYRDEQAGELQGLTRVRSITQDDAHVFCRPDQVQEEVSIIGEIIEGFYRVFDFAPVIQVSLRDPDQPEKYLGTDEVWEKAEKELRRALAGKFEGVPIKDGVGEAAFYGPKLDFMFSDSLNRQWQLATIQLDFNMPERFGLKYMDQDGLEKTPVMIHRAIAGSLERFMAILLEHYAGALPLWLSPVQVKMLPISDEQNEYAASVQGELVKSGLRVEVDDRSESIGKKIREAQNMKVPVMLIVGKKEVEAETVAVRWREKGDAGTKKVVEIAKELTEKVRLRD
ncbi:MAG: threonine--tRNA ligase [bacterium]|nr:threonine--tRNA ligase [bacterium]